MSRLFGEKLRHLRRQRQLTQVALAQQLQLAPHSHSYIANLEAGDRAPSLRFIMRVAILFGVRTDYLLRDVLPTEPPLIYSDAEPAARGDAPKLFGAKLRRLRLAARLTQGLLAQQLGLARHAYISNLEAGRKEPSPDLVVRLAEHFGVSTDYLLRDAVAIERVEAAPENAG